VSRDSSILVVGDGSERPARFGYPGGCRKLPAMGKVEGVWMLTQAIRWLLLSLLFVGVAGAVEPGESLQMRNAWIRDAPPSARMRSGYAVLANEGSSDVEIVAASSPDFGLIEMHETRIENDVARMAELPSVKIAAGASFRFEPGGAHFMLMQPKRELKTGDSTTITLTLKSGVGVVADFVVGPPL
jgi:periplasmic copper chaperone A